LPASLFNHINENEEFAKSDCEYIARGMSASTIEILAK
jgi:hypothetical protein